MSCKDQGTEFEFTVVLKFNQGIPGNRGDFCRGSFFVFLEKQKRKTPIIEILLKYIGFLNYFKSTTR